MDQQVLFIHQNFPGQFLQLAQALSARKDTRVTSLSGHGGAALPGVRQLVYQVMREPLAHQNPYLGDAEAKLLRAEAVFTACLHMKEQGYRPDVVIAHTGWGEAWFIKDVWPAARLAGYCEYYYRGSGSDVDFDAEFPNHEPAFKARLRTRNMHIAGQWDALDAACTPTVFQRDSYPPDWRARIAVLHEGIDTQLHRPGPRQGLILPDGTRLSADAELVTFVNRNLEPLRGWHQFARSLPLWLKARPHAHAVIVGGDKVSYGAAAPHGLSWKSIFWDEVKHQLDPERDWSRVHFVGQLPYAAFRTLLRNSSAHVYLTYPFVLSWSLLEAMSTACPVVASDVAPVREVMTHERDGLLVPFFEPRRLAQAIIALLEQPALARALGQAARERVVRDHDLAQVCLPRQIAWFDRL